MSIWTGKDEYCTSEVWPARTRQVLEGKAPKWLENCDLGLNPQPEQLNFIEEVRGKVAQHKEPRVLEMGCGYGIWASHLSGLYSWFTGVDITPERIAYARKHRGDDNVEFYCSMVGSPWIAPDFYDVALTITVIQHVPMYEAIEILKTIHTALKPGGKAYLREGRLGRWTEAEAESIYADPKTAAHMIAKPISILEREVPGLQWEQESGLRFTLTKI